MSEEPPYSITPEILFSKPYAPPSKPPSNPSSKAVTSK